MKQVFCHGKRFDINGVILKVEMKIFDIEGSFSVDRRMRRNILKILVGDLNFFKKKSFRMIQ